MAKKIFARHSDWCWKFYGDGKELENIKKMVHENNLEKNVIFCGRTSSILEEYKKDSELFANPDIAIFLYTVSETDT